MKSHASLVTKSRIFVKVVVAVERWWVDTARLPIEIRMNL